MTPNELVLIFRGSYVCANFGENRSRNVTVRVLADGQTHRHTDRHAEANRFYNLSRAVCYSYGTDNNNIKLINTGSIDSGDLQDRQTVTLSDGHIYNVSSITR